MFNFSEVQLPHQKNCYRTCLIEFCNSVSSYLKNAEHQCPWPYFISFGVFYYYLIHLFIVCLYCCNTILGEQGTWFFFFHFIPRYSESFLAKRRPLINVCYVADSYSHFGVLLYVLRPHSVSALFLIIERRSVLNGCVSGLDKGSNKGHLDLLGQVALIL